MDHDTLNGGHATSSRFQTAARNVEELRSIEATLATMQLADAQREVASSQRQVAEAQQKANEHANQEGAHREEFGYWARKFLTNITIANSAGFAAIVLFISKPDSPLMDYKSVEQAAQSFFLGMTSGGIYPLLSMAALEIKSKRPFSIINKFPRFASALNTIASSNTIPGLYAALSTILLMIGVILTYKTTTEYYQNRALTAGISSPFAVPGPAVTPASNPAPVVPDTK